jgi:uncharacterized protein YndB with AHSA1/START domain
MAAKNESGGDVVVTREFDAPRDLVFNAWTDPRHMSQWWGPHGFTNPKCELDPRPGGRWRIVMRAPDGSEHPAKGVYREVAAPERLVLTIDHSELSDEWHDTVNPHRDRSNGRPAIEIVATVTFEELNGKTRLTLRLSFESTAVRDMLLKIGMSEGWSQSLERLESLAATESSDREIVMTRLFKAPRPLVFKAFTDPEHLKHWWGPRGFTTTTRQMDLRPGGIWRLVMHGPDGRDYHNRIVYLEVVEPERLVLKHEPDEECEPVGHQTTVTFADEGDATRVEFRMTFPSTKAREYVVKTYGAIEGGRQTFDRLGEHLASIGA